MENTPSIEELSLRLINLQSQYKDLEAELAERRSSVRLQMNSLSEIYAHPFIQDTQELVQRLLDKQEENQREVSDSFLTQQILIEERTQYLEAVTQYEKRIKELHSSLVDKEFEIAYTQHAITKNVCCKAQNVKEWEKCDRNDDTTKLKIEEYRTLLKEVIKLENAVSAKKEDHPIGRHIWSRQPASAVCDSSFNFRVSSFLYNNLSDSIDRNSQLVEQIEKLTEKSRRLDQEHDDLVQQYHQVTQGVCKSKGITERLNVLEGLEPAETVKDAKKGPAVSSTQTIPFNAAKNSNKKKKNVGKEN